MKLKSAKRRISRSLLVDLLAHDYMATGNHGTGRFEGISRFSIDSYEESSYEHYPLFELHSVHFCPEE